MNSDWYLAAIMLVAFLIWLVREINK